MSFQRGITHDSPRAVEEYRKESPQRHTRTTTPSNEHTAIQQATKRERERERASAPKLVRVVVVVVVTVPPLDRRADAKDGMRIAIIFRMDK